MASISGEKRRREGSESDDSTTLTLLQHLLDVETNKKKTRMQRKLNERAGSTAGQPRDIVLVNNSAELLRYNGAHARDISLTFTHPCGNIFVYGVCLLVLKKTSGACHPYITVPRFLKLAPNQACHTASHDMFKDMRYIVSEGAETFTAVTVIDIENGDTVMKYADGRTRYLLPWDAAKDLLEQMWREKFDAEKAAADAVAAASDDDCDKRNVKDMMTVDTDIEDAATDTEQQATDDYIDEQAADDDDDDNDSLDNVLMAMCNKRRDVAAAKKQSGSDAHRDARHMAREHMDSVCELQATTSTCKRRIILDSDDDEQFVVDTYNDSDMLHTFMGINQPCEPQADKHADEWRANEALNKALDGVFAEYEKTCATLFCAGGNIFTDRYTQLRLILKIHTLYGEQLDKMPWSAMNIPGLATDFLAYSESLTELKCTPRTYHRVIDDYMCKTSEQCNAAESTTDHMAYIDKLAATNKSGWNMMTDYVGTMYDVMPFSDITVNERDSLRRQALYARVYRTIETYLTQVGDIADTHEDQNRELFDFFGNLDSWTYTYEPYTFDAANVHEQMKVDKHGDMLCSACNSKRNTRYKLTLNNTTDGKRTHMYLGQFCFKRLMAGIQTGILLTNFAWLLPQVSIKAIALVMAHIQHHNHVEMLHTRDNAVQAARNAASKT
jgi:hypothetical protein